MASMMTLTVTDLAKAQAVALKRRASRIGMTEADYVRELIEEDAELDSIAAAKSFAELAEPFGKALSAMSETQLNALSRHAKRKARR